MDYGSLKILKDTNFNQKPKKVAGNKIGLLSVIAIGFYTVSGGPYGLEQIVQAGGPFYALCGFSLFFVWAIPEALITAEMATALPETSGWVAWVTIAHGPYWGFQKGWLSWVSGVADNSLYPILFLDCLISLLKVYYDDTIFEHGWPRFFFILCATFGLTYVNYTGLDVIGWTSTILCPLSVTPFIIFCILGLSKMDTSQWLITPHNGIEGVNWTLFLNTFFWNINYWDSMSCFSNDIIDPSYNIPVGMGIAMLLVAVSIFLPILIGTAVSQDPYTAWTDGYFTKLGTDVGGVWLGVFIMVGATFSSIGQYEAEMSSDSFQVYIALCTLPI
jgi:amino acid transporter